MAKQKHPSPAVSADGDTNALPLGQVTNYGEAKASPPAFSADGEAKLSASGKLQGNIKNTSTFMLYFL